MREGAALLELQPAPHAVFEQLAHAVGVRYTVLAEAEHAHFYRGANRRLATVEPGPLVELARRVWGETAPAAEPDAN